MVTLTQVKIMDEAEMHANGTFSIQLPWVLKCNLKGLVIQHRDGMRWVVNLSESEACELAEYIAERWNEYNEKQSQIDRQRWMAALAKHARRLG